MIYHATRNYLSLEFDVKLIAYLSHYRTVWKVIELFSLITTTICPGKISNFGEVPRKNYCNPAAQIFRGRHRVPEYLRNEFLHHNSRYKMFGAYKREFSFARVRTIHPVYLHYCLGVLLA